MIKKITAYQTSDGSLFALEHEAQRHENLITAGFHRQVYSFQAGDELGYKKYNGTSLYYLDEYTK